MAGARRYNFVQIHSAAGCHLHLSEWHSCSRPQGGGRTGHRPPGAETCTGCAFPTGRSPWWVTRNAPASGNNRPRAQWCGRHTPGSASWHGSRGCRRCHHPGAGACTRPSVYLGGQKREAPRHHLPSQVLRHRSLGRHLQPPGQERRCHQPPPPRRRHHRRCCLE